MSEIQNDLKKTDKNFDKWLSFYINHFCHICKHGMYVSPESLGFDSDGSIEICNGEYMDYEMIGDRIIPFFNQCTSWRLKK